MTRREYKITDQANDRLNVLGADGWEMIAAYCETNGMFGGGPRFVFKRPLPPESSVNADQGQLWGVGAPPTVAGPAR